MLSKILSAPVAIGTLLSISAFTLQAATESAAPDQLIASADQGDAEAQYRLGRNYFEGKVVGQDSAKAFLYTEKAANQGHAGAQAALGFFYATGVSVPVNKEKAVEWFRKSADQGYLKAQLNLGQMIRFGDGTPKNIAEGLAWIQKTAVAGLPEGCAALGEIYFVGAEDIPPDIDKALPLLRTAAEAGNPQAENSLGVSYRDGIGVSKDLGLAEEWFSKSANRGNAKAQSNLGHLLDPDSKDAARREEALKWLVLAASQGEPTAKKTLAEMNTSISPAVALKARNEAEALKKQSSAQ